MADGSKHAASKADKVAHTSLYEAMCAAQTQFKEVIKSADGLHKAKYAPLDVVIAAIVPALNANGLVLSQPTKIDDGALILETQIIHAASGEVMACQYPVASLGGQHQQIGSSLTYARRYSLLALCGIAPENEDDAETKESAPTARKAPAPQQKVTPPSEPKREMTPAERMKNFKIKLSQQKDADEVIVLWESPRAEELRAALTEEQNKELSGFYGQVLSRFESVDA